VNFDELAHIWFTRRMAGLRDSFEGPLLIPLEPWALPAVERKTMAIDRDAPGPAKGLFSDTTDATTASGVTMMRVIHSSMGDKVPADAPVLSAAKTQRNAYAHVAVGRSSQNDVVIDQASVSRFHADIRWSEGVYSVRDAKSRNGTTLNGAKVVAQHGERLKAGDVVAFGDAACLFCPLEEDAFQLVFSKLSIRPRR
jgi:hypothetical protein